MQFFTFEALAVLFTVISIFLAGRNSVHTWWTGIIACTVYGYVFYDAKLYADVVLQGFFVITSIIGWQSWGAKQLPISSASHTRVAVIGALAFVVAGVYGYQN